MSLSLFLKGLKKPALHSGSYLSQRDFFSACDHQLRGTQLGLSFLGYDASYMQRPETEEIVRRAFSGITWPKLTAILPSDLGRVWLDDLADEMGDLAHIFRFKHIGPLGLGHSRGVVLTSGISGWYWDESNPTGYGPDTSFDVPLRYNLSARDATRFLGLISETILEKKAESVIDVLSCH
jgi:hypothetical protein